MTTQTGLQRRILDTLARVKVGTPSAPADTETAWEEIQAFAGDDEIIAALLELEEKGLVRSGVTRGVDGECAISTGVLTITDYGRQSLAR